MNHEPPESLDPHDWEAFKRIGHQMIDDMFDLMKNSRDRTAWQSVPDSIHQALDQPIPYSGSPIQDVYQDFRDNVLPYPTGNHHPRFFGWVMGNGTATGAMADFLISAMNCHVAGYDQAATIVENKVLQWLAQLVGFPVSASGLLVSGGTMANINALQVARNEMAGFDVRNEGIQGNHHPRLAVYGSSETHSWVLKACELMGLGRNAFRSVRVDANYQIDLQQCRQMILQDQDAGMKAFCLIGNAGTVNTAAIDDLVALRQIANEFGVWFHVDGAFGSMAAWSQEFRHLVAAQAEADSLAFDLHKWGYMPYEVACVLVKNPNAHTETFAYSPAYLASSKRGISVDNTRFADRGIQLSRSFRALKVWMSLKEQGVDRIGRVIQQNIKQAQLLERIVNNSNQLQLLAPVSLNIVCFRYFKENLEVTRLNEINQEILLRIQESGFAVPSQTFLAGNFAIRICITNHRSIDEDFHQLAEMVIRLGDELLSNLATPSARF